MNSSRYVFFIIFTLSMLILTIFIGIFFWSNALRPNSDIITIYTANYPLTFLTEEIAGDKVAVSTVIKPGEDLDNFTYDEDLVNTVGEADYYLFMPASESNEQLAFRKELAELSVQAVDVGKDIPYVYSDAYIAENGVPEGPDSSTNFEPTTDKEYAKLAHPEMFNPYVWTSPKRLKYMADNIYEFLINVDPKNKEFYTLNYNALIETINYYDSLYTNGLAQYQGDYLISNSEAAKYIAIDYGLILENPYTTNETDSETILKTLEDVDSSAFLYDPNDKYSNAYEKMDDSYKYWFSFNDIDVIDALDANLNQTLFTYYDANLKAIIDTLGA